MLTLEEERQSLLSAIVNYGFHVFWGAPHSFGGPTLHWNRARKPEIESFLGLAKAEGVFTLFVDWDQLQERDLDWIRSVSDSDYEPSSSIDVDMLAQKVGKIGRITVGYFKDGVCHIYEHQTPWFEELLQLEESTRERGRNG
jgi:hypothetical protein